MTFTVCACVVFARLKPAIDAAKQTIELSKPTVDKSVQAFAFLKPMIGDLIPAIDKLKQVNINLKSTNEN